MKKILVICPFDSIYPPLNGGMQRCFHLLVQLSKHFELTAIIHQDKESFMSCTAEYPTLETARIYSTKDLISKDIFSILPFKFEIALRSRWYQKELFRSADSSLIKYYPLLIKLLQKQKFDFVVLEDNATLNAVKIIRRFDKKVKLLYDAHNVDSNLGKSALKRKEITPQDLRNVIKKESLLHKRVDAVFTCSRRDQQELSRLNGEDLITSVVPNGVTISNIKYNEGVYCERPEYILFCGSLWSMPNAEGLYWFCKRIWPLIYDKLPYLKLLVIGSGSLPQKYYEIIDSAQIEFFGEVSDIKPFYNKAAVSIVPLLTGSGTRLKILEAMGIGVPVVSTSIGVEGIDVTDGFDMLIADNEKLFAEKVIELLESKEFRIYIQKNANKLIREKYDWDIIGSEMADFINCWNNT